MDGAGKQSFDPFMGSGTTLPRSERLGRRAMGIKNRREILRDCSEALSQEVLGL